MHTILAGKIQPYSRPHRTNPYSRNASEKLQQLGRQSASLMKQYFSTRPTSARPTHYNANSPPSRHSPACEKPLRRSRAIFSRRPRASSSSAAVRRATRSERKYAEGTADGGWFRFEWGRRKKRGSSRENDVTAGSRLVVRARCRR